MSTITLAVGAGVNSASTALRVSNTLLDVGWIGYADCMTSIERKTYECRTCGEMKAASAYSVDKRNVGRDGLQGQCRDCRNVERNTGPKTESGRWREKQMELRAVGLSQCTSCSEVKPLMDFYDTPDGRKVAKCKPCFGATLKRQRDPERKRNNDLAYKVRKNFGITLSEYDDWMNKFGGKCALCDRKAIHLDHDHETGAIRGPLCVQHNMALGLFGDSVEHLREAIAYLEAANATA